MSDIPLDDLLGTSDRAFEPVDSGDYFKTGAPFWEFADMFKWSHPEDTELMSSREGYYAAMFECLLKSGKPFRFPLMNMPYPMFVKRINDYGRNFDLNINDVRHWNIVVYGPNGEGQQEGPT